MAARRKTGSKKPSAALLTRHAKAQQSINSALVGVKTANTARQKAQREYLRTPSWNTPSYPGATKRFKAAENKEKKAVQKLQKANTRLRQVEQAYRKAGIVRVRGAVPTRGAK